MKSAISPSMMCADFMNIEKYIRVFETEKIEYLHIDIMDGDFVPNYTLGTDFCRVLKKNTPISLDIHLMISNPEKKLNWFYFGENDIVSVHAESTKHICKALQMIKERGAKACIAINPGTPLSVCEPIMDFLDGILIMTVNPGFSGGELVLSTLKKIEAAKKIIRKFRKDDIFIEVDGNVSFENAVKMKRSGADVFVAGTSSIFTENMSLCESISHLRKCIE